MQILNEKSQESKIISKKVERKRKTVIKKQRVLLLTAVTSTLIFYPILYTHNFLLS